MNVPILMYHSIAEINNPRYRAFSVAPSLFAAQMAYLHEQGFTPMTVYSFAQIRNGAASLPKRPVILTFDDAFEDFYTEALPVLLHYGFVASLYIPTAFVGKTSAWLVRERETNRPLLDWARLREVAQAGIECGAHTQNHAQLDVLPPSQARDELTQSKNTLEDKLGRPVFTFAYPYGYFSAAVRQMVIDCGYEAACAVRNAMSSTQDDRFTLSRLTVTADTGMFDFANLLHYENRPGAALYWQLKALAWRTVRRTMPAFWRKG